MKHENVILIVVIVSVFSFIVFALHAVQWLIDHASGVRDVDLESAEDRQRSAAIARWAESVEIRRVDWGGCFHHWHE